MKSSERRKAEAAAKEKRVERRYKWLKTSCQDEVRRHYAGIVHPDKFFKTAVAARMLYLTAQAADHYIYTIDNFCGLPYRDPKGLKLFKEMSKSLDKVLDYLNHDLVDIYGQYGSERSEVLENVNSVADLGNIMESISEMMVGYGGGPNGWRVDELMKTVSRLVSDEAVEDMHQHVRDYCRERLERWGLTGIDDQIAKGVEPADLDVDNLLPMEQQNKIAIPNIKF